MINKYKEGDLVWILHESRRAGSAPKLERNYKGPFIVTSCLSDVTFLIQMDQNGYKRVVNHDKLKPYEGEKPPNWTQREVALSLTSISITCSWTVYHIAAASACSIVRVRNSLIAIMEVFGNSLGKCRCRGGAEEDSGDGMAREEVRSKITGDGNKERDRSRSRSKDEAVDDRIGGSESLDSRGGQGDRTGRSRSRDRDERMKENVKEHRVERINWRSRSRSGERIRREREGVTQGQQGDCRKGGSEKNYRCKEGNRDTRRNVQQQRRDRSRSNCRRDRSRERTGGRQERRPEHERSSYSSNGNRSRERTVDRREERRHDRSRGDVRSGERDEAIRVQDRAQQGRDRRSESRDEGTRERWDRTKNERRD
ncbi:uncharacterized protein LOC132733951 [Ruditapes philippinarum]|uniref:uncharacterized protein LOC132733951 n=1 Tax=Ruditapes philippinarum TaxID=129788 RepID=UPI00295A8083|nr:uncharacterized protein LOC132733951 [Ruditapes philippinarum]